MDNSADEARSGASATLVAFPQIRAASVAFDRRELATILNLYGRHVADGEWRDYAMDFGKETASFSVFRHSAEQPLYRICKTPAQFRKQALYSVVAQGGLIMKRGNDLAQVLKALEKKPKLSGL